MTSAGATPFDERSWTDVLSNETYVFPLDALIEPADLIQGTMPVGGVPALLHEAAHHFAMSMSVGTCIAALDAKARVLAESGDEESLLAACQIALAIRVVHELYRPAMEGLALFTELDALPGVAKVISRPLLYVARETLSEKLARNCAEDWLSELREVLWQSRQGQASMAHREEAFSRSGSDPEGYLVGYAYVKSWTRWMRARGGLLGDTDFLTYLLADYLFNDYTLVALLTDAKPSTLVANVFKYCAQRLLSVVQLTDWRERATAFEERVYGDQDLRFGDIQGPEGTLDTEAAKAGKTRLDDLLNALPEADGRAIIRRSILHLASLPVEVVPHSENRIVAYFRDFPALFVPPRPGWTPRRGNGTLDIFFEAHSASRGVALSVDGSLAHLNASPPSDDIERFTAQFALARSAAPGRSAYDACRQARGESLDETWTRVSALMPDMYRQTYAAVGFAWVSHEHQAVLFDEPFGLRSVLGDEGVHVLAVLSAASEFGVHLEGVSTDAYPDGFAKAVTSLNARAAERLGTHLVNLRTGSPGQTTFKCRV